MNKEQFFKICQREVEKDSNFKYGSVDGSNASSFYIQYSFPEIGGSGIQKHESEWNEEDLIKVIHFLSSEDRKQSVIKRNSLKSNDTTSIGEFDTKL